MLVYKETYNDGCSIALWKMEEDEETLLSFFEEKKLLYREQISRFPYPKRRLEFLTSRLVLKMITGNENGICYDENGKPSLVDNLLKISISHTNGYLVVITHPQREVGIDIELKKEKIFRVKHKYLSPSEIEYTGSENELEHLLLQWSAKETMYKLLNIADVDFVKHLHISPFTFSLQGEMITTETRSGENHHFRLNYRVEDEYVMVWGMM